METRNGHYLSSLDEKKIQHIAFFCITRLLTNHVTVRNLMLGSIEDARDKVHIANSVQLHVEIFLFCTVWLNSCIKS